MSITAGEEVKVRCPEADSPLRLLKGTHSRNGAPGNRTPSTPFLAKVQFWW